jgi:uncharacterized protein (UPF0248 family)
VSNREIIGIVQPIHEVLNRIRWDPSYDGGRRFALTYVDHAKAMPVIVPFSSVTFDAGSSRMIGVADEEDEVRKIPLHRIRQVLRDGVVIWERPMRGRSEPRSTPEASGHSPGGDGGMG